jgi:hypothetical protein
MRNLQVEELEQRQLLNGSSFSIQLPPIHFWAASASPAQLGDRAPFVDLGSRSDLYRQDNPGRDAGEFSSTPAYPSLEEGRSSWIACCGGGQENDSEPVLQFSGVARQETRVVVVVMIRVGVDYQTIGSDAAVAHEAAIVPEYTRSITLPLSVARPEPINTTRAGNLALAEAVSAAPAERPILQAPSHLANAFAAPVLRVEVPGPAAAGFAAGPVRGGEIIVYQPDWSVSYSPPAARGFVASLPPPASGPGQVEELLVLPSPQVAGVLPVFAPLDPLALELGMQHFLDQLADVGRRLAGDGEAAGLGLWIVAGAASATACALAYYQLRRRARGSTQEGFGLPGSAPDHLFAG